MCNIAFFRKTEEGERLYLEVLTDCYYIDYDAKTICFHRVWGDDWIESKYETINTVFEKGFIYIKVVD